MSSDKQFATHWNRVAANWPTSGYSNPILAAHKRSVYTQLMLECCGVAAPTLALKTDLFAEAFGEEEFLSALTWSGRIVGIDISNAIVATARETCHTRAVPIEGYVTCDVRQLPFRNGCYDLVLSDSTLDHLPTRADILTAVAELGRVLEPGGRLILTLDNPGQITYPPEWLVRLWMRLGLAPYYIGVTLSRRQLRAMFLELGLRIERETAILHYPHPDGLVRAMETLVRRLGRGHLDPLVERAFHLLE
ncbi:MAG: methyltransferase domain-containing protein, partial [Chloroflexi bacterium]|nr:methyltransferase domain-containing protein [Chloroflexota bacterium]